MRASRCRVVGQNHVPLGEPFPGPHLELHGLLHGTQVHGNVRRVGDEAAVGAKQGAREIQTLLDVRRNGRALEDPEEKRTSLKL